MTLKYSEWQTMIKDIRKQWNKMWWERINDKVRAEGIANQDFPKLFVERGIVIAATRNYRPPNFEEIVEKNRSAKMNNLPRPPHPTHGGYGKFIREVISKQKRYGLNDKSRQEYKRKVKKKLLKKNGRGWLHSNR